MNQSISHDEVRSANLLRIFNCIRKNEPITKKQIQNATALSWGYVSTACTDLLQQKIICEEKLQTAQSGRTPLSLKINPQEPLIIGLDIEFERLTGVVIDLSSNIYIEESCEIIDKNPNNVIYQMMTITRALFEKTQPNCVKGIAISSPGYVEVSGKGSVWNHLFGDIDTKKLCQIFETRFGVTVLMERDSDCRALAEHLIGCAKDVDDFLFVRLSLGIDMAIMIDEQLYQGKNHAAGELGHMKVNPRGERCHCGNYGCLETFSSVESIVRRCTEAAYAGKAPYLRNQLSIGRQLTLETAAAAARNGDTAVKKVFMKAAHYAGIAIANAVNLFDPQAVVLGGELAEYHDIFVARLQNTVKSHVWTGNIDLRTAQLEEEAAAVGAASLLIVPIFNQLTK